MNKSALPGSLVLPGVTLAMGFPPGLLAMAEEGSEGMEGCWLFCLELHHLFTEKKCIFHFVVL